MVSRLYLTTLQHNNTIIFLLQKSCPLFWSFCPPLTVLMLSKFYSFHDTKTSISLSSVLPAFTRLKGAAVTKYLRQEDINIRTKTKQMNTYKTDYVNSLWLTFHCHTYSFSFFLIQQKYMGLVCTATIDIHISVTQLYKQCYKTSKWGYRIRQVMIKFHTMICNLMSYINIHHNTCKDYRPVAYNVNL